MTNIDKDFFNLLDPFYLLKLKSKNIIGRLIVTLWFIFHIVIIIIALIIVVRGSTKAMKSYNNTKLEVEDYGRTVKEKFGGYYCPSQLYKEECSKAEEYKELTNQEAGTKYLNRYGINYAKRDLRISTSWEKNIFAVLAIITGTLLLFTMSNLIGRILHRIWT